MSPSSKRAAWRCRYSRMTSSRPTRRFAPETALPAFRGISLAWNCDTEADVDAVLATAVNAGGKLLKPAQKAFWGGYHGYFADPEGHLWEVAHNPHFPLSPDGKPSLARLAIALGDR